MKVAFHFEWKHEI